MISKKSHAAVSAMNMMANLIMTNKNIKKLAGCLKVVKKLENIFQYNINWISF